MRASWLWVLWLAACTEHGRSPPDGRVVGDAPAMVAKLTAQPLSFDFGSVLVGTTSATATIVIINVGAQPSGLISAQLSGPSAGEFGIVANSCAANALAGGAMCTLSISFTPFSAGTKTVTVTASATPGGSVVVMLGGVGVNGAL
jgi:hypothetical protein